MMTWSHASASEGPVAGITILLDGTSEVESCHAGPPIVGACPDQQHTCVTANNQVLALF